MIPAVANPEINARAAPAAQKQPRARDAAEHVAPATARLHHSPHGIRTLSRFSVTPVVRTFLQARRPAVRPILPRTAPLPHYPLAKHQFTRKY